MKIISIFILLLFCPTHSDAVILKKKPKKVLFIGNSLTYYHDMPQTVQKMIDEEKLHFIVDQSTFAGYTLSQHSKFIFDGEFSARAEKGQVPNSVKKILSEKWDVVILQEQGISVLIPEFRNFCFEPAIIFLDSIIKSNGGTTVLFQEYSGNFFPSHPCVEKATIYSLYFIERSVKVSDLGTSFCSYKYYHNSKEEFDEIEKEYNKMVKKINAGAVKVGYSFEKMKINYPNINLYDDEGHPSQQGSYLIACLFFKYITGKNLQHVKYSADLDAKQALLIRKFADTIK